MTFNQRCNPAAVPYLGEVPVEVVLPEYTRVALMGENVCIGEQFVVNDGVASDYIMVLNESDCLGWPVKQ